jgi:hypothetical protein
MPGTLLAAIEAPVPVQQQTTALLARVGPAFAQLRHHGPGHAGVLVGGHAYPHGRQD